MKIHYNQSLRDFSKRLRNNSTIGEVLLWKEIKGRKMGFQFMRQKPIMGYIVDFYCAQLKLAIEIDGSSHDTKLELDIKRQKGIEELGVGFLRFTEKEVRNNLGAVVNVIKTKIEMTTPASRTRHPLY